MEKNKRKTTTIRMPEAMKAKLAMYAKLYDVKQSDIVREAIQTQLAKFDYKVEKTVDRSMDDNFGVWWRVWGDDAEWKRKLEPRERRVGGVVGVSGDSGG